MWPEFKWLLVLSERTPFMAAWYITVTRDNFGLGRLYLKEVINYLLETIVFPRSFADIYQTKFLRHSSPQASLFQEDFVAMPRENCWTLSKRKWPPKTGQHIETLRRSLLIATAANWSWRVGYLQRNLDLWKLLFRWFPLRLCLPNGWAVDDVLRRENVMAYLAVICAVRIWTICCAFAVANFTSFQLGNILLSIR